ncbi:DUF2285 domain-containing protein [uncultured Roseobacter sp.]|uniref:DUF2285 domain-containing protein n=1 Tax=uncultured Roseobacter sp. TaxID=114847 RepID=UPI0026141E93|nr:DUF2285 domain-containing protein [uncultured Roseobacter sp.]
MDARLYWKPTIAPAVSVLVSAVPDERMPPVRLDRIILQARRGHNGRHWASLETGMVLVSDNPFFADKPLGIVLPLDPDWSVRVDAAQRLRTVWRGRKTPFWFTDQRRRRIGHALRTTDAQQSGARLRDIAIAYFGAGRIGAEPWKTSALKAQVARLARYGEVLVSDGYRQLLRGKTAGRSQE